MTITELTAQKVGLTNNPSQHIPKIDTAAIDFDGLAKLKFEVLSDKTVDFDAAKGTEYIDLPIFPGEREVGDAHVQFLYDEMWKGTFNEMLVILSSAVFQGVTYKINGQHTAWAVVYMNEKRKGFKLRVREIKYRVQTLEQLKLLYASYDRLKARTDAHVSKVFLIGTPATEGIWNNVVNTCASAFKFWHVSMEHERRRISPEQLAAVIQRDYANLFRCVAKYVQDHNTDRFATRMPIVAAMFATFEKLPSKAHEFWDPVITGLELPGKTDPRYALRDLLITAVSGLGRHVRTPGRDKRIVSSEDLYRIAVSAWNKWRREEKVQAALRPTNERMKPV